jgi:DNA-binding transcriptional LysR family regulator
MPDLRQLRALQAVAKAGSFSGAAEALNYTQPAVSKSIAALERELGAVLVERAFRPVRLTDAGAALVRHADELFARLSLARAEIDAITEANAGTVCVGTFGSAAAAFVVDALRDFRKRHPGVEVSIVEGMPSSLVRRLEAGELDLAVVFDFPAAGEDIGAGLELHDLLDQPFDVVLHPDHPLAREGRVRPVDLADDDWILQDFGPASPTLRLIGRMCAAAGFEPRVAFRVNDCQVILAMVAAGEGVSILPRLMLDPLRADVAVKPVDGAVPTQRVAAVRLPTRYLAPAAAEFLVALRDAAHARAESWAGAIASPAPGSARSSAPALP